MSTDRPELKRLLWQCRRGMKEMDVLLVRYLELRYADASAAERQAFQDLLGTEDDLLWRWLSGRAQPPDPALAGAVDAVVARPLA